MNKKQIMHDQKCILILEKLFRGENTILK
jgi:hypothetical protein